MKRIRRSISPLIIAGLGVWFLLKQNASMEILGIVVIVLSGLGIVLSVTDKESTKVSKGLHIGVDGVLAAGGVWLLVSPLSLTKYLKYILGAIIVIYTAFTLRRMFRFPYRAGFRIAEAVPLLLGAGIMLIPLAEDVFPYAAGGHGPDHPRVEPFRQKKGSETQSRSGEESRQPGVNGSGNRFFSKAPAGRPAL